MKILVCGGRHYGDQSKVWEVLNSQQATMIIHGGATGADDLAGHYAREQGITEVIFPANWEKFGKIAGLIRNREMLRARPALVVAFPGNRGTENMIMQARTAGIPVRLVE